MDYTEVDMKWYITETYRDAKLSSKWKSNVLRNKRC